MAKEDTYLQLSLAQGDVFCLAQGCFQKTVFELTD